MPVGCDRAGSRMARAGTRVPIRHSAGAMRREARLECFPRTLGQSMCPRNAVVDHGGGLDRRHKLKGTWLIKSSSRGLTAAAAHAACGWQDVER